MDKYKKEEEYNAVRRRLMRMGFGMSVASLTLKGPLALADQTISFPSPEDIVPEIWSGAGECIFTSTAIEGPYYLDDAEFRHDIRDDEPGQELRLRIEVATAGTQCGPVQDAVVQIWHCNATGWYSGFPLQDPDELPGNEPVTSQGSDRFLRGAQVTDEQGRCEFISIYPGWYAGRTVHIHAKIYLNGNRLLTTQLYFPDDLNDSVLQTGAYRERGISPFRNSTDMAIAGSSGAAGSWPQVRQEGDAFVATLRIGVLNG
jgi:protocatechuate 3,4-dioxygenase beta subunit